MKLIDLSIGTSNREKVVYNGSGSECTIKTLYLQCLGKKYEAKCRKVVVVITNDNKIYNDKILNLIDYIEIYEYFDFEKFNSLGKYEKKLMMLDTLQSAMLRVAKEFNLNTAELNDSYNCCIKRELICEWYLEKEKYFLSPDKKFYARIWASMDSDILGIYIIFYNKKKEELKRVKIIENNPCHFDNHHISALGWINGEPPKFRVEHNIKRNLYWDASLETNQD